MIDIVSGTKSVASRAFDGVTLGYLKGMDKVSSLRMPKRGDERGDIVQTIIIIAIFVVIVVVVGNIIYNAVVTAAQNTSKCITSANVVKTGATTTC